MASHPKNFAGHMLLVLVLQRVNASPYNGCLSLDILVYSLFHHELKYVLLCMLNVLSMLQSVAYLESS